jgi:hypothetical protein
VTDYQQAQEGTSVLLGVRNGTVDLVADAEDALFSATMNDDDVVINITGSSSSLNDLGRFQMKQILTAAREWSAVLKTLTINPADYGLQLTGVPRQVYAGRGCMSSLVGLAHQEKGWLRPPADPVGWVAAGADMSDPFTPVLIARTNDDRRSIDWVVVQPGIDRSVHSSTVGLMAFPWYDGDGMAAAADLMLNTTAEELGVMRALADADAVAAFRRRQQLSQHKEELFQLFSPQNTRTPASLLARLRQYPLYPSRARYDMCAFYEPVEIREEADEDQATKRNIAIRVSGFALRESEADTMERALALIERARQIDSRLRLIRRETVVSSAVVRRELYLVRAPRQVARALCYVDIGHDSPRQAWFDPSDFHTHVTMLDSRTETWERIPTG